MKKVLAIKPEAHLEPPFKNQNLLREIVSKHIQEYFAALDGQPAQKLYEMVMKEVELGLFKTVLDYSGGNQSKAADWLGLARGTLRKRLEEYELE